jgi:hypothetical protein
VVSFGRVRLSVEDEDGLTLIDALADDQGKRSNTIIGMGHQPKDLRRIILTRHPHVKGAKALKEPAGQLYAPIEEQDIIEGHRPSNRTTLILTDLLRIASTIPV